MSSVLARENEVSLWRRALDRVAHIIWDGASYPSRRERLGNRLCYIASEWTWRR